MTYADAMESAVLILDESHFEDAKAVATPDLGCSPGDPYRRDT
jgi:hypothetical protein